jgi:hypothetical protein
MKQGLKIMLGWLAGMMCLPLMGQDPSQAPRGIFSVGPNRYVQFKEANESKLMQWASIPTEDTYGWRVLTSDEWTYLLVNGGGEGRENGNDLNALGCVNGKNGLVILPDGWAQPEGVPPFVTVSQEGFAYENNVYTSEQWAIMAASGAAFLPAEGYGYDKPEDTKPNDPDEIEDVQIHGAYWAADAHSAENAHCMRFNDQSGSSDIHDLNNQDKYTYYSVRLARTVVILDEMDETEAFLAKLPEARTKSFALVRRTLGKDATFYTLCLPFDVPDIEESPLAGAEVFTFAGGSVSGGTGYEQLNLDLVPYTNPQLSMGVPYVLRWANTGERMTFLRFDGVVNWAAEGVSEAPSDPGNENIKFHGLYPRKRIPGYNEVVGAPHYNFFMGANNTLYWPDDIKYPDSKMKGFRAYFYLDGGGPNGHEFNNQSQSQVAARYRNMPAVWRIQNTTTDIEQVPSDKGQCTKVIKNGVLLIRKGGKEYNILGEIIK